MPALGKIIAAYTFMRGDGMLTDSDLRMLTHVNFAFGHIKDGGVELGDADVLSCFERFRAVNPDVKLSLSLVGKTGADFPQTAASAALREKLAGECVRVMDAYGFDGIDLDWEYPCCPANFCDSTPDDKYNFTLLCRDLRDAFDKSGKKRLLTVAAGADEYYVDGTEMDKVCEYVDTVYVMTYDLRCGFHSLSGHHTNLYPSTGDIFRQSAHRAVGLFTGAGVPKHKICIGAAFYSRMLTGLPDRYNGYMQYSKEHVVTYGPNYHELAADYINKNGYTRFWDDECKAPYLWNPDSGTFISYDDAQSLAHKSAYVLDNDIAGIFYWNHVGDNTHTLLRTIYENITKRS